MHDVVVVGAGPVGSTLALALSAGQLDVVVLDARAPGETPRLDRWLALSHGARLILDRIGVWRELADTPEATTPIKRIDVSQAGGFGRLQLDADEEGLPALGYVVSYRALQAALDAALSRAGVAVQHRTTVATVGGTPAYAAVTLEGAGAQPLLGRLAAVADGGGAALGGIVRQRHDYDQVALVANLRCATPHGGLAVERFTPDGPIALLPQGERYGLVWTVAAERAQALLALPDAAFLAGLARHFAPRTGRFEAVTDRRAFPLVLEFARVPAGTRTIAVGNAAQTLHPVAGQGFNVGLRDAWELATVVLDTPREAIGGREMVARYLQGRRVDRIAGIAFTHGLIGVFGNDVALLRWPRGLALTLLGALPPAKRAFTRAMLYGLR